MLPGPIGITAVEAAATALICNGPILSLKNLNSSPDMMRVVAR
jgi:hypothetical protein